MILELNARRPGRICSKLYEYLTGRDMEGLSILNQWGYDIEISNQKNARYSSFVEYPPR